MSSTLETTTKTGPAESYDSQEMVIDVAGIVPTPASLDESTTTTTEAATEEIPFDPSANTDAGIEPRTEQAEPGNDVAEEGGKGGQGGEEWSEDDIVTTVPVSSFYEGSIVTEEDGEILRESDDKRAYREYERRRNSAQSRVADAYLDMVSAKVAAKAAADHLTSEGEALEKIVAGGWRAIKREMEAAGRSASVYQDAADDVKGKPVDAIKAVAESLAEMHVDSIYGDSATLDAQAPSEAVSDAWKHCTIAELCAHGVTQSVMNRLDESGIGTIGKLAQFVEDLSLGKEKRWPKGIGEAKVTMIEDALTAWLTKNRDSGTFGAIPTTEGDEIEADDAEDAEEGGQDSVDVEIDYPGAEAWDNMLADSKKAWLAKRVESLADSGDLKIHESEKAYKFGRQAWDDGKSVSACDYFPGARCDDWLRGWIVGSQEPEAASGDGKAASVDELFE